MPRICVSACIRLGLLGSVDLMRNHHNRGKKWTHYDSAMKTVMKTNATLHVTYTLHNTCYERTHDIVSSVLPPRPPYAIFSRTSDQGRVWNTPRRRPEWTGENGTGRALNIKGLWGKRSLFLREVDPPDVQGPPWSAHHAAAGLGQKTRHYTKRNP